MKVSILLAGLLVTQSTMANITTWSDKTICRLLKQDPHHQGYINEAQKRQLDCFAKPKKTSYYKIEKGLCPNTIETRQDLQTSYSSFSFQRYFHPAIKYTLPAYRYTGTGSDPADHKNAGSISPEIKGVADLNNDGIDDLWIDFYESEAPSLVLYGSADGQFIADTSITMVAARRHIRNGEIADINGDGWLDLIGFTTGDPGFRFRAEGFDIGRRHIPRGDKNLLLVNQQGQGFQHQALPEIRRNDWNHGGSAGDINGDGLVDILPLSEGEQERTVPLFNQGLVQGQTKFKLNSSEYSKEISRELTSDLDAADLNGDGIDDMVIIIRPKADSSNEALARFGSLRVIYGDNDTKMSNNRQLKFGQSWLTEADVSLFQRYGKGDRMLAGAQASGEQSRMIVGNSNVEILDINGDQRPDILEGYYVTNTGLWQTTGFKVYLNQGDCFVDGTEKHFPNQITNRSFHENNDRHTNYIHNFRLGDLNNDGHQDLVLQVDGHSDYEDASPIGFPYVFINDGKHHYLPPKQRHMQAIANRQDDLVPGDFNGDGLTDLVSIYGKHLDFPKVHLYVQKSTPDGDNHIYPNNELSDLQGLLYERINKVISEHHTQAISHAQLTELTSTNKPPRTSLNGQYAMQWYFINIGSSGGYEQVARDIISVDSQTMKLLEAKDPYTQPQQRLRQKLNYQINELGQFRIQGELDLFEPGRAYNTEILGNLHNGLGLGIWHDGDPMLVLFEKID